MENEWIEKLAIQELLARYAHAIDDLRPEAWVKCFTSDGIFQLGSRALRGHDALRAYGETHAREMRYRHMIGNFLYEVVGNEAGLQLARRQPKSTSHPIRAKLAELPILNS